MIIMLFDSFIFTDIYDTIAEHGINAVLGYGIAGIIYFFI